MRARELPERRHVAISGLPAGASVAIWVRREEGVRLTRMDLADAQAARDRAGAQRVAGHPVAVERAMLAGCLLRWDEGVDGTPDERPPGREDRHVNGGTLH